MKKTPGCNCPPNSCENCTNEVCCGEAEKKKQNDSKSQEEESHE